MTQNIVTEFDCKYDTRLENLQETHFSKTRRWKDDFGRDLKQDLKQIQ